MTRRQLTDPFGSDDEEESIRIENDKISRSISASKLTTSMQDVSMQEIS